MAKLNPALRDFWNKKYRNRILHGGRSSSKSHDAAGVSVIRSHEATVRVLCVRQQQNKITDSVYTLIKNKIDDFGLKSQFEILRSTIRHKYTGSEFLFYGIAHNIDELKSLEGVDILYIEEAHNLSKEQWEILEPTIRKEGSEVWIVFNPRFTTDFVWKKFVVNPPPDTIIRQINYDENPFLSDTMIKIINHMKEDDYEEYLHIYGGVPRDSDDGVVIKSSWIQAAIDAHLKIDPSSGLWEGQSTVGYDVADDGDDMNATTNMNGFICNHLDEWKGGEDELLESAMRVKSTASKCGSTQIGYDSIGVGAGTGSHLNSLQWKNHFKFNAAGKVNNPDRKYADSKIMNKDFFSNLKAQAWWLLADRFRNTYLASTKGRQFPAEKMISISSKCDKKLLTKLCDELATPKRDYDNAGRVKVESKKELAKREVPSPNLADSFVIANSRGMLARKSFKEWL